MKEIQLTQGKVALVDDEDFEYINQFKWYAHKNRNTFYAIRNISEGGRRTAQYMHRLIMNKKGIDHKDHNGLNNQRNNLRICTRSQNGMNRILLKNKSSVYKGVCWIARWQFWQANIMINQQQKYLGIYKSELDAAKAYNIKAIELFGEFAQLNEVNT